MIKFALTVFIFIIVCALFVIFHQLHKSHSDSVSSSLTEEEHLKSYSCSKQHGKQIDEGNVKESFSEIDISKMSVSELVALLAQLDEEEAEIDAELAEIDKELAELKKPTHVKLPKNVALDSDGLPYKTNRVYGYGKQFNVFITRNGKYFHRNKCRYITSKHKILLHRYTALQRYLPCPYCKPISYIDNWYMEDENSFK